MPNWYIQNLRGKSEGPFSEADIIQKIKDKKLLPEQYVWSEGMKKWEPIGVHFKGLLDICVSQKSSVNLSIDHKIGERFFFVLYSCLAGFSLVVFWRMWGWWYDIEHTIWFWLVCALSYLGVVLFGILTAEKSWKISQSRQLSFGGVSGGGYKVYSLLVLIFVGCFAINCVFLSPMIARIDKAREKFSDYELVVHASAEKIALNGPIGPYLSNKLSDALSLNSSISSIEINSYGGLIDEAFKVAKIIESRGSISVTAHGHCNSACLIIFMAGNKRYADKNMTFGFHAGSAVTDLSSFYLDDVGLDADAYLLERGVPQEIIGRSFSGGHDELYVVPATRLYELGVIDSLLE